VLEILDITNRLRVDLKEGMYSVEITQSYGQGAVKNWMSKDNNRVIYCWWITIHQSNGTNIRYPVRTKLNSNQLRAHRRHAAKYQRLSKWHDGEVSSYSSDMAKTKAFHAGWFCYMPELGYRRKPLEGTLFIGKTQRKVHNFVPM